LLGCPFFVNPICLLHHLHVPSGTVSNHGGFGGTL